MNGPDHYRAAEQLLGYVQNSGPDPAGEMIAAAQVHAMLAVAAALTENSVNAQGLMDRMIGLLTVPASEAKSVEAKPDGGDAR